MCCHQCARETNGILITNDVMMPLCLPCLEKEKRRRKSKMFGDPGDGTLFMEEP
jgi:hypothetical protein